VHPIVVDGTGELVAHDPVKAAATEAARHWIEFSLPPDAVDSAIERNRRMLVMDQAGPIQDHLDKHLSAMLIDTSGFKVLDPMPVPGKFSFRKHNVRQSNRSRRNRGNGLDVKVPLSPKHNHLLTS
jgi:hypothetical protein